MNKKSRTKNTLISAFSGVIGYLITYVISFIYRSVFIYSLGSIYLGVQGLFSNILSMLSLAELGISTAITFSLYKPLAENDIEKIKSLLQYFKKAYRVIMLIITLIGVGLTPFLSFFVKEMPDIKEPLWFLYLLYVADIVFSYFQVYKQSLIRADQRVYTISIVTNILSIVRNVVQMIWLLVCKTFVPVLIIQIGSVILTNVILAKRADVLYPYLRDKNVEKLDVKTKGDITKKVKALFLHNIGAFVVSGTDNILISKFIGLISVGLYSNYNLILSTIRTITGFLIKAVTPSVGNYVATKSCEEGHELFKELSFLFFWLYSFCSVMLIVLFDPFIELWLGNKFLIDPIIAYVIVFNFYLYGMNQTQLIYRNVLGLYVYCRWKPIAEAIINITASLILIKSCGFVGVFLGTTISFISTALWVEPYVIFKHYFHKNMKRYTQEYIIYLCFTVVSCLLAIYINTRIQGAGFISFVVRAIVTMLIHTILFVICFCRTKAFNKYYKRIKSFCMR